MALPLWYTSQYTIIYKYGKCTHQLKKGAKKYSLKKKMVASRNHFTPELNEKEVIELLEDLSNILGAFLIKRLLHSRLLDMR